MSLPQRVAVLALEAMQIPFETEKRVGRYYVDIVLPDLLLAIEIDGEFWHSLPRQQIKDRLRDGTIRAAGLRLARIPAKALLADPKGKLLEAIRCTS